MSVDTFGAAVRRRLEDMGRTHEWLGHEAAAIVGRGREYHQSTVTTWINGRQEPPTEAVFAIEKALQLRGGTLSRELGYLPASARPLSGVVDAVRHDPRLTESGRRVLLAVYQELIASGPDGS